MRREGVEMYHIQGREINEKEMASRVKPLDKNLKLLAEIPLTVNVPGHQRRSFPAGGNVSQDRWDNIFTNRNGNTSP